MNTAEAFLDRNWERLSLEHFGARGELTCVMATPRFKTSAHVIFLIVSAGSAGPVLVIKAARRGDGPHPSLDREASNLLAVQSSRPAGFRSIPRLVAYDHYGGTRLLVETGVPGQVMKPSYVRRRRHACVESVLAWVVELHSSTMHSQVEPRESFDRLVVECLEELKRSFATTADDAALMARTFELAAPLREATFPLVFEHGDLSAPNILVTDGGEIGVVDWELAEPSGLPVQDLFFALCYLAFAKARAQNPEQCVAAFHQAFFTPRAWARPYVQRYAQRLSLDPESLKPLFIACWSRYVARLCGRFEGAGGQSRQASQELVRRNRYFALWQHAVRHADEIQFTAQQREAEKHRELQPSPAS